MNRAGEGEGTRTVHNLRATLLFVGSVIDRDCSLSF